MNRTLRYFTPPRCTLLGVVLTCIAVVTRTRLTGSPLPALFDAMWLALTKFPFLGIAWSTLAALSLAASVRAATTSRDASSRNAARVALAVFTITSGAIVWSYSFDLPLHDYPAPRRCDAHFTWINAFPTAVGAATGIALLLLLPFAALATRGEPAQSAHAQRAAYSALAATGSVFVLRGLQSTVSATWLPAIATAITAVKIMLGVFTLFAVWSSVRAGTGPVEPTIRAGAWTAGLLFALGVSTLTVALATPAYAPRQASGTMSERDVRNICAPAATPFDWIAQRLHWTASRYRNGTDDVVRMQLPPRYREVLEHLDGLELEALAPGDGRPHPHPPLGRVVIADPSVRTQVVEAIFEGLRTASTESNCHDPHHAVFLHRGSETLRLTICYHCSNVGFDIGHEIRRPFAAISSVSQPLLDQVLLHGGVPSLVPTIATFRALESRDERVVRRDPIDPAIRDLLEHAESYELLSLDPEVRPATGHFHGFTVLRRIALQPGEGSAHALVRAWLYDAAIGARPSLCFHPRHALIARRGTTSLELIPSYGCSQTQIFRDGQLAQVVAHFLYSETLFDALIDRGR